MNFFHHKDLGNHLLQLFPKVVKHPVSELFTVNIAMGTNSEVWGKKEANQIEDDILAYK
jgi:hypothetical protein